MLQEEQGNMVVARGRRPSDSARATLVAALRHTERNVTDVERIIAKAKRIAHRLDLWHKSKHLQNALLKAAAVRGNEELLPWVKSIRNYFWLCSKLCEGSVVDMKVSMHLTNWSSNCVYMSLLHFSALVV